jgi:signal peptidase I
MRQWTVRTAADWGRVGRGVLDFAKTLVIAFILAQLVMVSVAQAYMVEQYSMQPTLLPHDRVLVNKFVYRLGEPRRGDIVVLRYPRDRGRNYIKRIVAVPGDRIEIREGHLRVNGTQIEEFYINGSATGDYGPEVAPDGSYFVLGDNRNNSEDSRAFGFVKRDLIVGRATVIYWPPQRIRVLRLN